MKITLNSDINITIKLADLKELCRDIVKQCNDYEYENTPAFVDKLMTLNELCEFLPEKPSKQTIYGKVWRKTIPFEKCGKSLYFRTSQIKLWLDSGRILNK